MKHHNMPYIDQGVLRNRSYLTKHLSKKEGVIYFLRLWVLHSKRNNKEKNYTF